LVVGDVVQACAQIFKQNKTSQLPLHSHCMQTCDVVIVGAGAAGLFCAGVAGQLGLSVVLIDHSPKVAEKIRISGGGRCNSADRNIDVSAPHKHFKREPALLSQRAVTLHRAKTSLN
jgi:NAD/NADP transhydrogenase alpha subunit